jgi:hypothetical protein
MSRRLLALNVVLGIVSVALAVGIARTLLVKRPAPGAPASRAASAPAPAPAAEAGEVGPAGYAVIAARNLFNPARSETAVAAVAVAKPILHGVVIDGARRRAFLEDPSAKRVAGYSVGDTVGGGKLEKISDDRVVIARPEGSIEVLLQDPSKPRAAPTVTAVPGQVVPQGPAVPPGQLAPPQPVALPNQAPPTPPQVRRRVPGLTQGQPSLE